MVAAEYRIKSISCLDKRLGEPSELL